MLAITSLVCLGEPWGHSLGTVPGFIESSFNPLVYECVGYHIRNGSIRRKDKLAIVLGSAFGDATTADVASQNLICGRINNPLLFYQSVPNSILGYLSREYGFTGVISCISYSGNGLQSLLQTADLYANLPDVEQILLIGVEVRGARSEFMSQLLSESSVSSVSRDYVISFLVEKAASAAQYETTVMAYVGAIKAVSEEEAELSRIGDFARNDALFNMAAAVEQLSTSSSVSPIIIYEQSYKGEIHAITLTGDAKLL